MRLLSLRSTSEKRIAALALAFGCLTQTPAVYAQSSEERMGARAAASEGARAFSEKRWADAIDYFKRAESLVHALPHLLYIARAQAQTGQFVEARENYLTIIHEELKPDAPQVFKSAKESASKEIHDVETHFAYATVTLKGDAPKDIVLMQDGARVPSALIGIARPVNPGTHKFEVTGTGVAGSASLTIKEAERQKVVIELAPSSAPPAAPPEAAPAIAATATVPQSTEPASTTNPPQADQGTTAPASESGKKSSGLLIGSFVGFGVGVVGLAVGTVFTLNASSKQNDSDNLFNSNDCAKTGCTDVRPRISDLDDQAKSARTLGLVGFIAGGVGVAAGATLLVFYLRSGSSGSSASTGQNYPSLLVSGGPGSVSVRGTF